MTNYFYGYKLKNGEVHTRRYFSQDDVDECDESPFVVDTYGPIPADDIEDARGIMEKALNIKF